MDDGVEEHSRIARGWIYFGIGYNRKSEYRERRVTGVHTYVLDKFEGSRKRLTHAANTTVAYEVLSML